jgi:hypothetical protein
MPITFTVTAYKANELSAAAREEVLDEFRSINVEGSWWTSIYKEWIDKLEKMGFEDVQINFSGFYSQGDGASFTAKGLDLLPFMRGEKLGNKYRSVLNLTKAGDAWGYVKRDHSSIYCHENTVSARVDGVVEKSEEVVEYTWSQMSELQEYVTRRVRELSKEIYKELEVQYEFLTSDEQVEASLVALEYLFDEEGHQIYYYAE